MAKSKSKNRGKRKLPQLPISTRRQSEGKKRRQNENQLARVENHLSRLNRKKDSHKKKFETEMKKLCAEQERKMKMTKGGRAGGFFSKYRYNEIVRIIKLNRKLENLCKKNDKEKYTFYSNKRF